MGGAKRFYSTNHKPNKDNLSDNSNIDSSGGTPQAGNNKLSSTATPLVKKVYLFLMRLVITTVGIILAKSLFLC